MYYLAYIDIWLISRKKKKLKFGGTAIRRTKTRSLVRISNNQDRFLTKILKHPCVLDDAIFTILNPMFIFVANSMMVSALSNNPRILFYLSSLWYIGQLTIEAAFSLYALLSVYIYVIQES
ncbi:hypothetical protein BD408DRAFT_158072 [Parasitella parasitica]|nr:hypothetical protein BD408DRAFT_158072 [Parasitella parasitica]